VDCLLGIQNGGVKCYISSDDTTTDVTEIDTNDGTPSINVFPNPGKDILNWEFTSSSSLLTSQTHAVIEVRNELGQTIFQSPTLSPNTSTLRGTIPTNNWPGGVYILALVELSGKKKGGLLGPPLRWVKLN
ncbi:MAG: hypothetical protein P8L64_06175, partial [Flavobacteriales bacterium]|nr:hypothetical protein [Flavobacteriales bacterium]